jgi:hypothetical protein
MTDIFGGRNPTDVELLDDRSFGFRLILFNEDGKFLKLRQSSVTELVIEDNIFDMCHSGHLVFKNPHDVNERATSHPIGDEDFDINTFRFRGDARDFIIFEMYPTIDGKIEEQAVNKLENDFYTMRFVFCIHKIEDVPTENAIEKHKKLTFHDRRIQELLEKDLYWNSGTAAIRQNLVAHKKPLSQLNDEDRSIYTGAGIRDMIEQTFPKAKFAGSWDNGGRQVFYTSPAGSKAYDDIVSLCKMHVSSDDTVNQPCMLRLERYTNQWSLLPYSYYFDKSYINSRNLPGQYQNERFYVSNEIDLDMPGSNPAKGPVGSGSGMNNVHFPDLSIITGYMFSEMPGSDNQKYIVTTPTHTYHSRNKTFNFLYKDQAVETMYDFFKETISDKMLGGKSGPYTDFFINNTKKENRNVNLKNSNYNDRIGPLIESRNDVMKKALFNGPAIQFTVKGSTNRRAARYISLDRQDPYEENDYDSKLLGQYLVTRVKHIITESGYTNNIIGVKPYYYNPVDFNHDIA